MADIREKLRELPQVWYSAFCGYWTTNWTMLAKSPSGIPLCPKCGAPGMVTDLDDWNNGLDGYEDGHPGYKAFLRPEVCYGNGLKKALQEAGYG